MHVRDACDGVLQIPVNSPTNKYLSNIDPVVISPPLDDETQSWLSRKFFMWTIGIIFAAGLIVGFIILLVKTLPRHHHRLPSLPDNVTLDLERAMLPSDKYTIALSKALMFFNAQRSGKLPKNNNVTWRGNSGLNDGKSDPSSVSKNLAGGYYDDGDAIKFNFPQSFAMTMLSWSVIEYRTKYEAAGELNHIKDVIKWGTDYLLKTFNSSADTIDRLVMQVGSGDTLGGPIPNDHYCWMRPEDINYEQPVAECYRCSDLSAEISASIVFKDNKAYSQKLVHGAKTLFNFSRNQRGKYSTGTEAAVFYDSTSYWDEFVWGGAWMYYATGNNRIFPLPLI